MPRSLPLGTALVATAGLLGFVWLAAPSEDPGAERGAAGRAGGAAVPDAETPFDLPRRSWIGIATRVYRGFSEHRIMANAASVTFYSLLAIFPALAALVSIYGLFADPSTIEATVKSAAGVVPGGGMDILTQQIHALASKGAGALSFGAIFGLATALWSSNQGTKSVFDALNIVYDETEKRSFLQLTLTTLAITASAIVFLVVALSAVVVLPIALKYVGLGGIQDLLVRLLRWPALMLGMALLLAVTYRYGPSRARARWRWVSWGSVFAALLWLVVSFGFSAYVESFGSYNKTYGSLGAVVGFMTWIWISSMVVLIGAELDAEMEHATAADTTTGPRKPLGARGATKADTVATEHTSSPSG